MIFLFTYQSKVKIFCCEHVCIIVVYFTDVINIMYTLNAVLFTGKLLPFFYKAGSSCFCVKHLVLPYLFLCNGV